MAIVNLADAKALNNCSALVSDIEGMIMLIYSLAYFRILLEIDGVDFESGFLGEAFWRN